MNAIVYVLNVSDEKANEKRLKQLEMFIKKKKLDVVCTYYDVLTAETERHRLGLKKLVDDVCSERVRADAFICLSMNDLGTRKRILNTLGEINAFIPTIYFVNLEMCYSDGIA